MNYKKYILSLGLCGVLATSIFAEEKTIKGRYTNTTGSRVDITGVSGTTDLILDSTPNETAKTGEMYRAKNNTVHTVKAINGDGAGDVNMASSSQTGYFTVDVNSDTDITAISASSWKHNYMTLNINNSHADASKANVKIDFGNSLTIDSTTTSQQQEMNINVAKGTVYATKTTIGESATNSKLTIGEDSNISWNGYINVGKAGVDRNGQIVVNGTLQLASGGKSGITLNRKTSLIVGANGKLDIINNSITINKYASMTVNGTLVLGGGSYTYVNGTLTLNNTKPSSQQHFYWLESSGSFTQATADKNNGIRLWRKSIFKNGADWTVDEILDLFGNVVDGASLERTRAYAVMQEDSRMVITKASDAKIARIRLWGNSELQLYQENVFSDQDGNSVRLATAYGTYSEYGSVVRLYSEQTFSDIYITTGSNLEIYLENDMAKLILDGTGNTLTNHTEEGLKIYNFREDAIYIGKKQTSADAISRATFYDENMNVIQVTVRSDGWLTAVVVPEPAEWAMIFGGIALGLAMYRRRK